MIDSHAHITSDNYENIEEIIHEIKNKGVKAVINAADKIESSYEVIELSRKYKNFLLPAVGIHPESTNEIDKIDEIEEIIRNNKVYAVGEIGLDYYYQKDNKQMSVRM